MAVVIEIPLPGGAGICLNMPDWIVVLIFIMIFRVWGWPMVVRRWPLAFTRYLEYDLYEPFLKFLR
ncbi:uncharacterized protein FFB20_03442 [Fusarium fujikuroi]|uniref:Uncharacterized protein n=3 Tax=Fusarium fujikuroi species complex TaxID=171627 RepID=S0ECT0_GIBF5|nr:uncharacterized protein FFUJ_08286 [Fusarium fujikuroi IMI 58289]XP_031082121.1 uncharacterized protein FPRO_11118 [Fusarium proliferatum ET1]KLP00583.1 uncharacterized protein Y057_11140 [Fusarium fujikuroi]CCT71622.1 uncharacterized protein FFUJ_08286 [Fusarium fujikuroi IMI 58289]CZR41529.1 uncharacterized protein FPRO_11118 [Fusarium proliferatum ET1]SCN69380.1 uncharacterized protein FFB20_03442 [Fusarium fujikuroi]SCO11853.1 uncharacterized protein FFE2_12445 [Fusarium fujikuroi]